MEEFKIQTRELGLREDSTRQSGRKGGIKSAWHGRLFENFRNDILDAVPHEITQNGGDKRTLRRNQFGFNISGPVVIPKLYNGGRSTFFSLSYEGVRERIGRALLNTIATSAEKAGDWSKTVDSAGSPLPIYDPASTRPNPGYNPGQPVSLQNLQYLRDPFPANRIPEDRIDPVAREATRFYPDPNTDIGPFFRNNYFLVSPEVNTANGIIAKVDHSLRDRHRLSIGITYSNGYSGAAALIPTAANPGSPDRDFFTRRGWFEHVFTISPNTVNTFTFEGDTEGSNTIGAGADYAAELGLQGVNGSDFPLFEMGGAEYLGMGRALPDTRNTRNTFTFNDGFSHKMGRHNLRVNGSLSRQQVNTFSPQYPSGHFRFGPDLTGLPGIVNTGHAFASFLLGLPEFAEVTDAISPSYFRRTHTSIDFSDRWEVSTGLTVSVGAALEIRTPRTEEYDRQSTVDLNVLNPANNHPGALVIAGLNGQGRAFQPVTVSLSPRAGIAWSPLNDTRTVLRASFGRSYGGIPINFGQWGVQGFVGTPTYISPNPQLEPALTLKDGVPPPAHPVPDLRPDAANDTVAELMEPSGRLATYQSMSVSVERQLPASVLVTVGAYQSGGKNLLVGNWTVNPNAIPLSDLKYRDALNDDAFNRSLRPYPQYLRFDVSSVYPLGRYNRDAAYFRVEKRASQGLTVSASYEFSKQMDDYSGPVGTQDFYNRGNEWALTAYNRPHVLSLNYTYELPIGPNRAFWNYSDWKRYLVDGWSLSGITVWYSGEPIAVRPLFNNTGGVVQALNVNVVPGVDPNVPDPGPELWFNPAAFDQPPDFTIGDASRTHPSLRNPPVQNHDLTVRKRFQLAADRALEFSAVGLNFINHANWNEPDPVIGSASAPNVNAGKIIGSRGGRIVQVGVRYSF